jgi:peptidoglycan/xylan/chitin deacetylase (PgdA/CDA1 family)
MGYPADSSKPITILMYHSVSPDPCSWEISPQAFRRQIEYIAGRYSVIRLSDIRPASGNGADMSRKVIVTFDDGFCDFQEHAYPVLEEFGIPLTLFVVTGLIGQTNRWDAPYRVCREKKLMDARQLDQLRQSALVDFGSHSVDHKRMSSLPVAAMRQQAVDSKRMLENLLSKTVTMFSYPFGQFDDFSNQTDRVLAEAGYELAVTTIWGTRNGAKNLFRLRRVFLSELDSLDTVRAKIEGRHDWLAWRMRAGYLLRTLTGQRRGL